MQGTSLSSMKKHPALIPLYVCIGVGGFIATFYTLRLAFRSPDVSWFNKKEAEPWNSYKDKQYKFISPVRDYSKEKSQAPEY
ncbi:NADH dehydrogenase [ubiquinone] 1 alpha subcomplex subunit 4 [Harpegnathos saltator]|uniref:NADH dehydrogenase [ubiquinone] 1 alpha subcomplex subunit 4 n=2 Tax=Harpegnathos saltator TaxID=610380 RepID=E2B831_HARSA|nr:NADH dehydrogenase [ubiquinone] 1 alpha subcomplex subunit 4 [Harpegnathos saltator]